MQQVCLKVADVIAHSSPLAHAMTSACLRYRLFATAASPIVEAIDSMPCPPTPDKLCRFSYVCFEFMRSKILFLRCSSLNTLPRATYNDTPLYSISSAITRTISS